MTAIWRERTSQRGSAVVDSNLSMTCIAALELVSRFELVL